MMKYIAVALPMAATFSDAAIFSRNGQRDSSSASSEPKQGQKCTSDLDCLHWVSHDDWNTLPKYVCQTTTNTCQPPYIYYAEQSSNCYAVVHTDFEQCLTEAAHWGRQFTSLAECLNFVLGGLAHLVDQDTSCPTAHGDEPVITKRYSKSGYTTPHPFCDNQLAGIVYRPGNNTETVKAKCVFAQYCDGGLNKCQSGQCGDNSLCEEHTTPPPTPVPTTSTTTTPVPSPSPPAPSCAAGNAQCGGKGWTGPTTCCDPYFCEGNVCRD